MSRRVVITGARAPVAIDLARAFAAAGHEVWLADSVASFAARWSRVGAGRVITLAPARHAFGRYRAALRELASDPHTWIVPTCEEVFYVAQAAAHDGYEAQVFAPPPALLRRLHSKIEFPAWARSLGIEAPETHAISDVDAARALLPRRQTLVLKPEFSRFGTATLIRPTSQALNRLRPGPGLRWAAQPFVAGEEVCLWTAACAGRIVASAAYRPRWRLGQSAAYAFEALDCPAALDVARTLARASGLTGHLSLDLILTPDGRAVPIECNPRAVSGLHLFGGRADLARALLGEGEPVHVTEGVSFLSPAMALMGLPQALLQGRLGEFAADVRRGRDALTQAGDRWPALGAVMDAVRFAAIGLTRHRSPTRQTTDDIEWNGEPIA